MYIERHIEKTLKKAERQTKVVLLTGARQVGKSTIIRKTFPDYEYITLDDDNELILARNDRTLFFKDRKYPIIIDEVQYEKELMRSIKHIVDESADKGRIFLTGSQTYELLSEASESLSGRISILEMSGLACREIYNTDFDDPFIPSSDYLNAREEELCPYNGIWNRIHRGSMPELMDPDRDWEWFYRDYIRTYIERDVRKVINIKDEIKFRSFLVSLAARTAQILVYDDIARDVGVDIKTVQSWISAIAASGLIKIIHPYHNNAIKRATKAPKIYFMDTGLVCYFVGWNTIQSARNGAMSGELFETFIVSEIMKSYMNAGKDLDKIYFYRDKEKREIDLLIEEGNTLYPIEIKKGAAIQKDWTKNFGALSGIKDHKVASETVICQIEKKMPITDSITAIPVEYRFSTLFISKHLRKEQYFVINKLI